jgi:branched-chain amino acid transport system substrate-binding protein
MVAGCVSSPTTVQVVRIGADLELTGPGAELGLVYRQALQLRVDQVNEKRLLGNRRLELVVVDNRTDGGVAATNVARLAADPQVVAIVSGGCEECVLASVEAINGAAVPVVSLGAASALVEPIDQRRYMFKLGPDAADVARVLAGELRRGDVDTTGLIAADQPYGVEAQAAMAEAAERAGIEVLDAASLADDGSDADAAVTTIIENGPDPDAVVIWASGPASIAAAIGLRQRGYEGELLLGPSAAGDIFLTSDARAALEGARLVFTESLVVDGLIASSPAKAARQAWLRDYAAEEGTYDAPASFAADAVQVIVEAINRNGSTDRESVRSALENTQIDGFTGPIRFRLETHSGLSAQALVILVAQGDRWRLATS